MPGMVCQHCAENPATIHFTEIKDDERVELHVCEECATAQGITTDASMPTLLANMVMAGARGTDDANLTCPRCGMTWREFRRKGRLGCPHDYEVFETVLLPLLEKMHGGADRHTGRLPGDLDEQSPDRGDALLRLRRELQDAVNAEHYEQAARLRDEIDALEARSRSV